MQNTNSKIFLPLALGVILPLLVWLGYRSLRPPVPSLTDKQAKLQNRDVGVLNRLDYLMGTAEQYRTLSDADWAECSTILKRTEPKDQEDAMRVFTLMGDSSRVPERLAIARNLIRSTNTKLETQALRLLWVCHAAEWKSEAQTRQNSGDDTVRKVAQSLLNRGEYVLKGQRQ